MRGLKRGLLVGLVLAVIVFLLPDGLLGALTVGSGLAALLPAAAPPLGTTARLLLAIVALGIGFALTLWLARRRTTDWDPDVREPAPLPASEQMVVSPTVSPAAAAVATSGDLESRVARIEAAVTADRSARATAPGSAVLARLETLESQIDERLAAIEARLTPPHGSVRTADGDAAATARLRSRLADIRRSIDGV